MRISKNWQIETAVPRENFNLKGLVWDYAEEENERSLLVVMGSTLTCTCKFNQIPRKRFILWTLNLKMNSCKFRKSTYKYFAIRMNQIFFL